MILFIKKETEAILQEIKKSLEDREGLCIYISGVPGSGKTATIHSVMKKLNKLAYDRVLELIFISNLL